VSAVLQLLPNFLSPDVHSITPLVIDVPANGVDWRQRAEPREYIRAANIPGMDDGIAADKGRERLRPQQAMSIGNRANGSHHTQSD